MLALARRDYAMIRTYRLGFALDFGFGFANLVVFYFISRTVQGVEDLDRLGGAPSYFAFVAVGIALSGVISAASAGLAQRLREEQLSGTLEMLVVQPIRLTELAAGLAAYPFLFAMVRAAFYILVGGGLLGLSFRQTSWLGFLVMLLAAAAAFSGLGILLGALVLVVKRGTTLVGLLIFVLGALSGAFFPLSVLPGWLEAIGRLLPTSYAFSGLRDAIFQGSDWATPALILTAFAAVTIPLALVAFRLALDHTRRAGTLNQY
jgi:ABC-2 type transport system permease protein